MPDITAVTHAQNIRYDTAAEALYIIDQTKLPGEEREIRLRTVDEMVEAIRALRVRGAPAIGICAAYCMYVLAKSIRTEDRPTFLKRLRDLAGAGRGPSHGGESGLGGAGDGANRLGPCPRSRGQCWTLSTSGPWPSMGRHRQMQGHLRIRSDSGEGGRRHPDPLQRRAPCHLPVRHGPGPHPAGAERGMNIQGLCRRDPAPAPGRPAHQLRAASGPGWT